MARHSIRCRVDYDDLLAKRFDLLAELARRGGPPERNWRCEPRDVNFPREKVASNMCGSGCATRPNGCVRFAVVRGVPMKTHSAAEPFSGMRSRSTPYRQWRRCWSGASVIACCGPGRAAGSSAGVEDEVVGAAVG